MRVLSVPTPAHGRILVEDPAGSFSGRMLVGCHGYGQNAAMMLEDLRRIPGAEAWRLVAVQALHRFYTRGDQAVVASWMTREDREPAIEDNIEYLNRAVQAAGGDDVTTLVYLGFSQGASMAARAATRGAHRAAGLICLAGDIPPDVKDVKTVKDVKEWPPVLIGVGSRDAWYGARVDADTAFLQSHGIPHTVVRFDGGHEFTDEFRNAVGEWMMRLS